MKKIGILGGTFDPIHNGHIAMGRYALEEMKLDEVWVMPTGNPAYKNEKHPVTDKELRYEMTWLAISEYQDMKVSRIEIDRDGNTYTSDTLAELKREYPEYEFFYIVGADSLDYMDRWHCPEKIFPEARILVVMRNSQSLSEVRKKTEQLEKQFNARITVLKGKQVDISSTEVRKLVSEGRSVRGMIADTVYEFILQKGLYQAEVN